jgi:hypothetical protein
MTIKFQRGKTEREDKAILRKDLIIINLEDITETRGTTSKDTRTQELMRKTKPIDIMIQEFLMTLREKFTEALMV